MKGEKAGLRAVRASAASGKDRPSEERRHARDDASAICKRSIDDRTTARCVAHCGAIDAKAQQQQIERVADRRGAKRAPEPVDRGVEKPEPARGRRAPGARRRRPPAAPRPRRRCRSCAAEEAVEKGFVDRGQPGDVGELDALVDLVHRLADEAELGDRAMRLDEARVGGAAGGAELRGAAGDRADRRR